MASIILPPPGLGSNFIPQGSNLYEMANRQFIVKHFDNIDELQYTPDLLSGVNRTAQTTSQPTTSSSETQAEPKQMTIIRHRQISTSPTTSDIAQLKQHIHEYSSSCSCCTLIPGQQLQQPDIQGLPSTGRIRSTYYTFQMTLPQSVHVRVAKWNDDRREAATDHRRWLREHVILRRVQKRREVGLREWEWAVGEPTSAENESAIEDEDEDEVPASANKPQSYAERVRNFSYTCGSDPVFQGRRFYWTRRRELKCDPEDYFHQVSYEDQIYRPPAEEMFDRWRGRMAYLNEEEKKVTAGDFLVNGNKG